MLLRYEDFRSTGGFVALVLYVPNGDGRYIGFVEKFGDGDTLVDGVVIVDSLAVVQNGWAGLRFIGEPIPSIYSSVYKKHLSHIIHKYVYNAPIKHATIPMGD